MRRANVDRVRPPVRPPGLREMHVRVDQARRDPHAVHVGDVDALRDGTLRRGSGAIDLAVANDDVRVRDRRAAAAVDQRRAGERARRGGRAGRGIDRAGDARSSSRRRSDEKPLGDAGCSSPP